MSELQSFGLEGSFDFIAAPVHTAPKRCICSKAWEPRALPLAGSTACSQAGMDVFDLMQEERERVSRLGWPQRMRGRSMQLIPHSPKLRRVLWRHYQSLTGPRVPRPLRFTLCTVLSSCVTVRTIQDAGGLARLPQGTQLLMLVSCLTLLMRCGFPLQTCGLSPLTVLERRQPFCLFISALQHLSLDHLLGNLPTLVSCGSYLESTSSTNTLTATVLSLTALSNILYGELV